MNPDHAPQVACIGAGYWGKNLIRNFHQLGALRMICESDAERREDWLIWPGTGLASTVASTAPQEP